MQTFGLTIVSPSGMIAWMHVIARPLIARAQVAHADARRSLDHWWQIAAAAAWHNLKEVQADFPATDRWGRYLIFNIKGNHYRLICGVRYTNRWSRGTLYVKFFLTHAEYGTEKWKDQLA